MSKYRIRQVITKMRRLVVCYVLPCYPHTVYMIMHQRRESIGCWDICCEDIKMTTICTTPENHLLTPITEEISSQIWSTLGVVTGFRSIDTINICIIDIHSSRPVAIPFFQIRTV